MVKTMINDIRIETERLILRAPTLDDAQEINRAMNEVWHDLQLWMSWAYDGQNTIEATKYYIGEIVPEEIRQGGLPLIGRCRQSGAFIVATGITMREGQPITGYWVARDFLGRGYATEAANAVLRYAFAEMGFKSIGTEHYEGNEKSRRVIEKLGFTPVRINHKAKARCLDGQLLDEHIYVMNNPAVLPPLDVRW